MDLPPDKLFDELHGRSFGRAEVTADRVVFIKEVFEVADEKRTVIENELFANYGLTKFLLLYLIRQALETSGVGSQLVSRPTDFLSEPKGRPRVRYSVGILAQSLARILSKEVDRRDKAVREEGIRKAVDPFDFKRGLKSPNSVRSIESNVISHYQIAVENEFAPSFDAIWKDSAKKVK